MPEEDDARTAASRRRTALLHALLGLGVGYVVLHPVSMVIFRWLDPRAADGPHAGTAHPVLGPILHSFSADMLPMGVAFAVFAALVASLNGARHATLVSQRDSLSRQLDLNRRYRAALVRKTRALKARNEQISRMERSNRRTTQYMAHDFKTYLGCIMAWAEVLLEDDPSHGGSAKGTQIIHRIRRQACQMMAAVQDLLIFARLKETRDFRGSSVAVRALLLETVDDLSLPSHTRKIHLMPDGGDCPSLYMDPRLIKRVIANLISNAIKHNGPDTQVRIGALRSTDGSEVVFCCEDDGRGIPPDARERLFEEFSEAATTTSSESTGLGLAFCRAAVAAHKGRIWCDSESRQGTRFYFTIPTPEEDTDESHDRAQEARPGGGG